MYNDNFSQDINQILQLQKKKKLLLFIKTAADHRNEYRCILFTCFKHSFLYFKFNDFIISKESVIRLKKYYYTLRYVILYLKANQYDDNINMQLSLCIVQFAVSNLISTLRVL